MIYDNQSKQIRILGHGDHSVDRIHTELEQFKMNDQRVKYICGQIDSVSMHRSSRQVIFGG